MVTENGGSLESRHSSGQERSVTFVRSVRTGAEPVGSPSGSGPRRTGTRYPYSHFPVGQVVGSMRR
jgi:hypothetical protein